MAGGELRFAEFEKRVERCSRPSPPPIKGMTSDISKLRAKAPPEVIFDQDKPVFEILVKNHKGEERLLDVKKFFNEREQRFIFGFIDRKMREYVAVNLFKIKRNMGNGETADALIDAVEKISKLRFGYQASIEFLRNIEHQSQVEWKRDALIGVMPAFGSSSVIESFKIFAGIGARTVTNAAGQIVEMGFRLKDRTAVEKLGTVIVTLNERFDYLATRGYRGNLMRIATSKKISNENRAMLVHAVSNCILKAGSEDEVERINQKVMTYLRNTEEPEIGIATFCGLPEQYISVVTFLNERAGKKPEDAVKELFAKMANEFNITNAERYAEVILSLKPGLLNKACEAVAFTVAAGGRMHAEEMAEMVVNRINRLNPATLPIFLREYAAFVRAHFNIDKIIDECNSPKWDNLKVADVIEDN